MTFGNTVSILVIVYKDQRLLINIWLGKTNLFQIKVNAATMIVSRPLIYVLMYVFKL